MGHLLYYAGRYGVWLLLFSQLRLQDTCSACMEGSTRPVDILHSPHQPFPSTGFTPSR